MTCLCIPQQTDPPPRSQDYITVCYRHSICKPVLAPSPVPSPWLSGWPPSASAPTSPGLQTSAATAWAVQ